MRKLTITAAIVATVFAIGSTSIGWARRPVLKRKPKLTFKKRVLGGVAILSPKKHEVIKLARVNTIKYLAPDATKVSLYLIIPLSKKKRVTRTLFKDIKPTGLHKQIFTEAHAPYVKKGVSPFGSHREYRDGPAELLLKAHINGKVVKVTQPIKIKIPRVRLLKPKVDTNIYIGLYHHARWSSIGQHLANVKLSVIYHSGHTIGGAKVKWSKVVPNMGKYRFRLPRELPKPPKGHTCYFQVEEEFPANIWDAPVRATHRIKVH